ncbi:MAG: chemotaxis protein CheX [Chloroflexi bacterium]|nr:chemotaxis protein CheX [Chloroflexota bacterium]
MSDTLDRQLFEVSAQIFEDLVFFFPSPELEPQQQDAVADATAQVNFEGPFAGQLIITLCGNLLPQLAANMLGADEQLPRAEQYDSFGEIGNVICGNLLPQVAGAEHVFRLAAPQVVAGSATTAPEAWAPLARACLGLEEGRADLLLIGDAEALSRLTG